MVNDPIGDMLAQIKNAGLAGKRTVDLPHSKLKAALAQILVSEDYLTAAETRGDAPRLRLVLTLKYVGPAPAITNVKRVSKPGLRWYVGRQMIPKVLGGLGMAVLSTPKGLMTDSQAKKLGIGGEVLCTIW